MTKVAIYDVTLRDGLQGLCKAVPTDIKVELAGMLSEAGFPYIEVGSFISPKIGQMYENLRDTAEVLRQVQKRDSTRYCALVPAMKYFEAATEAGFRDVAVVVSANGEHNMANVRRTINESLDEITAIKAAAGQRGIRVRPYISTAFGYRVPEDVSFEQLRRVAEAVTSHNVIFDGVNYTGILEGDVEDVSLGDTFDLAAYENVRERVHCLDRIFMRRPRVALHLHTQDPNVWKYIVSASIEESGTDTFDSSIGGYGGCPTDPSAGNIPTEELVDFLEYNGIGTGLDIDAVHRTAEQFKKGLAALGIDRC